MQLLDKPNTFRGTFGGITEDNRGQVALSQAGDKVFYVWFDTDTNSFPGGENTNPDAISRMFDVATGNWQSTTNLTQGSAADGVVTFGYVANHAGGTSSPYRLPIGYQQMTATDVDPVVFHYLQGVDVFTAAASAGSFCTAIGQKLTTVSNLSNNSNDVTEIYPNPTSGSSVIEVNMKKSANLSIEVSNMLGQIVYATNARLSAGTHKFTVETGKWNSGVYFYTVKSADFNVTRKLVRE